MVNARGERPLGVQLARDPGRSVAVHHAQLAPRAVAVGVDRRLRHAQLAGDLLRGKMLIHQPQAFAFPLREQAGRIVRTVVACAHSARSKRRLAAHVYFNANDERA
jgi:hypothetical protein